MSCNHSNLCIYSSEDLSVKQNLSLLTECNKVIGFVFDMEHVNL